MKGLLFLLCCVELLGSLLCSIETIAGTSAAENLTTTDPASTTQEDNSTADSTSPTFLKTSLPDHTSEANNQDFSSHNTSMPSGTHRPTTIYTTTTSTTTPFNMYRKECLPLFMVSGGLIIACTILLVSTLLLIWKVCQQSRHIKVLSSNADLISTSEYWMGTAKRNKSASELEAKENTVLMSDIGQTQEEVGNGTTKEEGGKVKEDGPKEEKKKEEETAKSEVAEKASKPQEEATDSKSTEAASASNCKGTEEPKDKV